MAGIGNIISVNLYRQVAVSTGDLVHDHIDNRLGEADGISGHSQQLFRHFLDQVRLRLAEFPGVVRLQPYSAFDM